MKKWNMFFGLMMASSIMFAQRKLDPMDRGARQAEKMKMELSLDDVQYKAVKAINEDFASEMMKLSADSTLSREDRHKKRQTLHQEKEVV